MQWSWGTFMQNFQENWSNFKLISIFYIWTFENHCCIFPRQYGRSASVISGILWTKRTFPSYQTRQSWMIEALFYHFQAIIMSNRWAEYMSISARANEKDWENLVLKFRGSWASNDSPHYQTDQRDAIAMLFKLDWRVVSNNFFFKFHISSAIFKCLDSSQIFSLWSPWQT